MEINNFAEIFHRFCRDFCRNFSKICGIKFGWKIG